MKEKKFILKAFDLPDWLIDNICDLNNSDFIMWLSENICKLIEITMEYQDLASHLDYYQKSSSIYDDLPFPEVL